MPTSKTPRRPKTNRSPGTAKRSADAQPALPDRRVTEAFLSMPGAGPGSDLGGDPLAQAQELIYTAWETGNRRQRVALAEEALRRSPLCADACCLLAEETAKTPDEALELYRKGIEAGERAIGAKTFEQDAGHFWRLLATRPYMRARSGLAQALWACRRHEEAIAHYRELLRLNPNDNQGNRYLLAACLLDLDRDADLAALLESCGPEATADWSYTRALAAFRRGGDTAEARSLLQEAMAANPHVPPYLLGRKKPPRRPSACVTLGGENEAQEYARRHTAAWTRTPGAVQWLVANAPPRAPKPRRQ